LREPRASATPGEEALGRIRAFVRRRFPLAAAGEVTDEHPLLDSGIVDSLGVLDLVTFLEKTFGIRVGDHEMNAENFASIASVARFVQSKRP
jgi:acyl carrier protein